MGFLQPLTNTDDPNSLSLIAPLLTAGIEDGRVSAADPPCVKAQNQFGSMLKSACSGDLASGQRRCRTLATGCAPSVHQAGPRVLDGGERHPRGGKVQKLRIGLNIFKPDLP